MKLFELPVSDINIVSVKKVYQSCDNIGKKPKKGGKEINLMYLIAIYWNFLKYSIIFIFKKWFYHVFIKLCTSMTNKREKKSAFIPFLLKKQQNNFISISV